MDWKIPPCLDESLSRDKTPRARKAWSLKSHYAHITYIYVYVAAYGKGAPAAPGGTGVVMVMLVMVSHPSDGFSTPRWFPMPTISYPNDDIFFQEVIFVSKGKGWGRHR